MMDCDANNNPFATLIEALESVPPPPCDGCPLYNVCATTLLACPAFFFYVHEPESPVQESILDELPSRDVYLRTYSQSYRPSLYEARPLSDSDKEAIRSETGTTRDVALQYKCSDAQVRVIHARHGRIGDTDYNGRSNAATREFENSAPMGSPGQAAGVPDRQSVPL